MLNEAPLTPLLVLPRGTFAKDPAKRDCAGKVNNFLVFFFYLLARRKLETSHARLPK